MKMIVKITLVLILFGVGTSKMVFGQVQQQSDSLNMVAFFYSNVDSFDIQGFKAKIESSLQENGKIEDVFLRHGAGPMGSHWNPWMNLLICFHVPNNQDTIVNVSIGGSSEAFNPIAIRTREEFYWLNIPQQGWDTLLKPVEEKDYELVYGADYKIRYKDAIAPLNTGYFLSVELIVGEAKLTKVIHVVYGE